MVRVVLLLSIMSLAFAPCSGTAQTIPQPRLRLLVVGDSLSASAFASSIDDGYAYRLSRALNADLGIVRASDVRSAQDALSEWAWYADIAIIEIGLNDVSNITGTSYPEAEWQAAYADLLRIAKTKARRVIATTLFSAAQVGSQRSADYQRYSEYIEIASAMEGITVSDVHGATYGCAGCRSAPTDQVPLTPFHGDNFHPNSKGHQMIADAIESSIRNNVVLVPQVIGNQGWN